MAIFFLGEWHSLILINVVTVVGEHYNDIFYKKARSHKSRKFFRNLWKFSSEFKEIYTKQIENTDFFLKETGRSLKFLNCINDISIECNAGKTMS